MQVPTRSNRHPSERRRRSCHTPECQKGGDVPSRVVGPPDATAAGEMWRNHRFFRDHLAENPTNQGQTLTTLKRLVHEVDESKIPSKVYREESTNQRQCTIGDLHSQDGFAARFHNPHRESRPHQSSLWDVPIPHCRIHAAVGSPRKPLNTVSSTRMFLPQRSHDPHRKARPH